jgi:hypothetical protein
MDERFFAYDQRMHHGTDSRAFPRLKEKVETSYKTLHQQLLIYVSSEALLPRNGKKKYTLCQNLLPDRGQHDTADTPAKKKIASLVAPASASVLQ